MGQHQLSFAAVEMRLMAPDGVAAAWPAERFSERNRHAVFMAWLNTSLPAPASGELHITELGDDE